jgi:hypothetical protein
MLSDVINTINIYPEEPNYIPLPKIEKIHSLLDPSCNLSEFLAEKDNDLDMEGGSEFYQEILTNSNLSDSKELCRRVSSIVKSEYSIIYYFKKETKHWINDNHLTRSERSKRQLIVYKDIMSIMYKTKINFKSEPLNNMQRAMCKYGSKCDYFKRALCDPINNNKVHRFCKHKIHSGLIILPYILKIEDF